MHTDDAIDPFPLGKRSAVNWDSRLALDEVPMARQCGADGLVFFTWEALRPFADELAGDIRSYGAGK